MVDEERNAFHCGHYQLSAAFEEVRYTDKVIFLNYTAGISMHLRHHKYLLSLPAILLLTLLTTTVSASENEIDGFGYYKFGMTLDEAEKVREDDELTDCDYKTVAKCLEYDSVFYGEEARVVALISSDTLRINAILVNFDRINTTELKACRNVLKAIAGPLLHKYGTNVEKEGSSHIWNQSNGNRVILSSFSVTDDNGLVVVAYEQGESL